MQQILSLAYEYALPFIAVISVVVFAHEFGHFWVARRCGIKVESFSIGFGKSIFGWTDKHGTRWQVAWLPFGGYVKMFGDADPASTPDASVKEMTEEEKKVSFYHQNVNKRLAVVAAGPVANYIFAILVLAVLFIIQGQPYTSSVVSSLVKDSVAERSGILPGDVVVKIDSADIARFEDIKRIISLNSGTPVNVEIERNGVRQKINMTPEIVLTTDRLGGEHKLGRIGIISNDLEYKKLNAAQALWSACVESWNITSDTMKGIGQMISGARGSEEIGGPLRIAQMSGQVAQDGVWSLIWFMAVISINLGFINLFPIPLLDGGHIMFFALEKLRGKPLNEKAQEVGANIGLLFVITLMLFATWNDLVHLEVFSKVKSLFS